MERANGCLLVHSRRVVMNKEDFLTKLESRLNGLPKEDVKDRLSFYEEMIDDKMEEGKTEEQAVASLGSVEKVVSQIASDTPLVSLVKERCTPKRKIKAWEIVLIALGFPIWLPLLIVAAVLILVGYLLLWVLSLVSYTAEIGLLGLFGVGMYSFFASDFFLLYFAVSIFSLGLALFMIFACIGSTKLSIASGKKILLSIKKKFVTRG